MSQALTPTSISSVPSLPPVHSEEIVPFAVEVITISKQEHIHLKWESSYWKSQYLEAVKRTEKLAKQLAEAEAKIKDLNHRIFGKSSEKKAPRSDAKFTGEKGSGKPRGQQRGGKGHGRTPRKELPVKEESVELPEGESCCPECGDPFIEGQGEEEADYIEIKVQAYTRRVKRKRYRRGCKCDKTPSTTTAPMPPRLLSRNLLGVSIWSEILLDKFLYYTPTHRLLQKYGRLGLPISPGTASDGLKRISPMFEPLVKAFYAKQMTESLFFGDETRWSVFEAVEGKNSTRWWIWIVISESVTHYQLAPGRDAGVPIGHFANLDPSIEEAIFLCDRFSSYKKMAKDLAVLVLAFCWAHVRRDFIKAARSYPDEKEWMLDWVDLIRSIYRINRKRCRLYDKSKTLEKQSSAFTEQQKNLENALVDMTHQRDNILEQDDVSKPKQAVLTSLTNHWSGLTVFVKHPEVPMDNNISERAARKPAILRNGVHGSGSQWAGTLMARMMTTLQTLLMWGINPHIWLPEFLNACAKNGGKSPEDLAPFLPWEMDDARKEFLKKPRPPDTS